MSCYLLFKEPMKYLVPRGSGRPYFFYQELVHKSSCCKLFTSEICLVKFTSKFMVITHDTYLNVTNAKEQ